jgi:hypothetical protein
MALFGYHGALRAPVGNGCLNALKFGALAMSANVVSLNERRPSNRMRRQDKPAAPASSDPIFAAIERYKVAVAELETGDGSYLNEVEAALAEYALLDTVPTTLKGPRTKIALVINDQVLDDCLRHTTDNETLRDFLNTIYKSAHIIAGLPEPAAV